MKRRTKQWLAAVVSAQTLAAGSTVQAVAQDVSQGTVEVARQAANEPVAVKPGALIGSVVNPTTGKPWDNTLVELVDPDSGKVLATTRTTKGGRYDLGDVKEGRYLLRINEKIVLEVRVTASATVSVLNVAIPTAVMGRVAGAIAWTTVGLVGAGALVAVAVPIGLGVGGGGGGGGGGPVSPS